MHTPAYPNTEYNPQSPALFGNSSPGYKSWDKIQK